MSGASLGGEPDRYIVVVWMHDHWGVTFTTNDVDEAERVRAGAAQKVTAVLVDTTAERVAEGLAALDVTMWYDQATALTCTEADAVHAFLAVFAGDEVARTFLDEHAAEDDEGDRHYKAGG